MNVKKIGLFLFLILFVSVGSVFAQFVYVISTGLFYEIDLREGANGMLWSCKCYSGAPGYVNDVNKIHRENLGPIPIGIYFITDVKHKNDGAKTDNTIVLTPSIFNIMYGRKDFQIHGDRAGSDYGKNLASTGCIIMDEPYRQKVISSRNTTLYVLP